MARLIDQAQLRLVNSASPISSLHRSLLALDLTNPRRLRPDWDQYFMQLASLAAQRSNCMKRRVGCVLVRERRVISTGYNGTPRNMRNCNEGGCTLRFDHQRWRRAGLIMILQAVDATKALTRASPCRRADASTRRRTPYSKRVGSGSGPGRSSTAIRTSTDRPTSSLG